MAENNNGTGDTIDQGEPVPGEQAMSDFYEEWAAETLANAVDPAHREPYGEAASELLSLARACRQAQS